MQGCWSLFAFLFLLGVVAAADWNYAAGFASWFTYYLTAGKAVMEKAYTTCHEYQANTQPTASGAVCIYHCVSFIFESFGAAFGGGYIIDTVQSGVGAAKETQSSSPPSEVRRDQSIDHHKALLDHFNRRSAPDGIRATHVVDSHVHPHDGLAIRMNVHGDDSAMHLHTNGSHAMILFDEETELQKRDFLDTDGHYFRFSGLNGFKAQAHSINQPLEWGDSIDKFVKHWTRSNMQSEPVLQQADAWRFEVCNEKKTATFFYGSLIAEANKPGNNYEPIDPPGCH